MLRIILNGNVTDLLEQSNPQNNLSEEISQDNSLTTVWSTESPSFLDRLVSGVLCEALYLLEELNIVLAIEHDLVTIDYTQSLSR